MNVHYLFVVSTKNFECLIYFFILLIFYFFFILTTHNFYERKLRFKYWSFFFSRRHFYAFGRLSINLALFQAGCQSSFFYSLGLVKLFWIKYFYTVCPEMSLQGSSTYSLSQWKSIWLNLSKLRLLRFGAIHAWSGNFEIVFLP